MSAQHVEHGDMREVLARWKDDGLLVDSPSAFNCVVCGKTFTPYRTTGNAKGKVCSNICREKYLKVQATSYRKALSKENSTIPKINDLELGVAAKHIVCADLLIQGYKAFMTDQFCSYDVAVDLGNRLIRVQVKATRGLKVIIGRKYKAYTWAPRRAGKKGKRVYGKADFDILALVAMDIRTVAYLAEQEVGLSIVNLRPPGDYEAHKNRRYPPVDENPFSKALKEIK